MSILNTNIRKYLYYLDLLFLLTQKELKVRYKNSIFGYLWSVANPLLYSIVFYFVFKVIMKFPIKDYTLFLITGLFPWQWIVNSINLNTVIFVSYSSLIKKINFPRLMLPLAQTLNDALHFVLSIPIIFLFALLYHKIPGIVWLYGTFLLIIPTFLTVYGISLAVASLNLFFRDLQYLIGIFLTIVFYLTPVFYDIKFVPKKYLPFVILNPFSLIIELWRSLFMNNYIDIYKFLLSLMVSFIIFLGGYWIYKKLNDKFAEVV